jgi:hypothetical protein
MYEETSDRELVAAHLNGDEYAKAEIICRHRAPLVVCLGGFVGDAQAAEYMVDILLDDVFANAAEYDPERESLLCWLIYRYRDRFAEWETPIGRIRAAIELQLAEANALNAVELERELRVRLAEPRVDTDDIDAIFAASTDHAATWERLDAIRRRAAEFQVILEDELAA